MGEVVVVLIMACTAFLLAIAWVCLRDIRDAWVHGDVAPSEQDPS